MEKQLYSATVNIQGGREGKAVSSDGVLNLDITISGVETSVAKQIVEEAHEVCPYYKAVRGNIEVETNVVG